MLALLCLAMPLTALAKGDVKQVAEKKTFTNDDTVLPYRLLMPENYDETKSYPMIVYFHGAGERGNDNELQLVNCVQYMYDNLPEDCIIVAPQCPVDNQWVDTPWGNGTYSAENVPQSNEIHAVAELIDELKGTYSIDSNRVYAVGMSMGGFAVWDIITRYNHVFAAAVPICAAGDPSKAEVLKDTPLFVFHGAYDMVVPVSGSRDTVEAIKNAGSTVIEYKEYELGDHHVWDQAIAEVGLLDKLLKCNLSSRPTVTTPQTSEPTSEATTDESVTTSDNKSNVSDGENDNSTTTIVIVVVGAVLLLAVVAVVVILKKKK